jgi:hypothetical protein
MVAMPQEKAMALLPELRDPARCEAAFTKILAGIENKSILLMAYPMVETLDGIRAVSENITELRYPTEYQAPQIPKSLDWKIPTKEEKEAEVNAKNAIPTSFETRNIGSTLEVEPVVSEKGDRITLQFAPQRTELLGYDSFDTVKVLGKLVKVDQPRFATSKITTNITVRSGEHRLIAVHKLVKPENFIELFIAQAVATPVK